MKDLGVRGIARSVIEPARIGWRRWMAQRIQALTGLTAVEDTNPQDIFICGYPKSGNTWFQFLVAALAFGIDVRSCPADLVSCVVPDVHERPFYKRFGVPTYFKTHHLPLPSYRRVVYLIRDGRDVMVSYFHYLRALDAGTDFGRLIREGAFPCKWHEHVNAYLKVRESRELMLIRYEDLKRDPYPILRQFCTFAGLARDEKAIDDAVKATTFEQMKKREQNLGWGTAAWPSDKPFIRRGVVGSFRDEMPPDLVKEFMSYSEGTLVENGYV